MDHMDFLGTDLAAVAGEKAAIQKPGVVSVIAPQRPEAATVIAEPAARVGAQLFRHGTEWTVAGVGRGMRYRSVEIALGFQLPPLVGRHPTANARPDVARLVLSWGAHDNGRASPEKQYRR